jgi:hypothetical protein
MEGKEDDEMDFCGGSAPLCWVAGRLLAYWARKPDLRIAFWIEGDFAHRYNAAFVGSSVDLFGLAV